MRRANTSSSRDSSSKILFVIFSIAVLGLSICVLLGCRSPSNSRYALCSVNGTNITHVIGKNCTSCKFNNVPDSYMFGMSGTCRSRNGTLSCQGPFPNAYDITAITFADVASNVSNTTSPTYTDQSRQYASVVPINNNMVRHLSLAVSAILLASVVLNSFFIPLRFLVGTSKWRRKLGWALSYLMVLDGCAQCAAVGMAYSLFRNQVARIYEIAAPGVHFTKWPVKFELGFWLLVGAAACRVVSVLFSTRVSTKGRDALDAKARQRGRANRIDVSSSNLTYMVAITVQRLRIAVGSYPQTHRIDDGCKELFNQVLDDQMLASIVSDSFNSYSAELFLGMTSLVVTEPPGQLLWESCPSRYTGYTAPPESRARGVYLVVLKECCHNGSPPTAEYRYVGSGRSAKGKGEFEHKGGVMLRVAQHTSPGYREKFPSKLYDTWKSLHSPCVAIYLLSEWKELSVKAHPASGETFDDILLTEAVWQVVLQTFTTGRDRNLSEFTSFLQGQNNGHGSLFSSLWGGCNVDSALEKSRIPRK